LESVNIPVAKKWKSSSVKRGRKEVREKKSLNVPIWSRGGKRSLSFWRGGGEGGKEIAEFKTSEGKRRSFLPSTP